MVSLTIPKILFNGWFWVGVMAIFIAIHYFWGKTPAPPKPSKFYNKHKKAIYKITDIFLTLVILFGWVTIIYISASIALMPIFNPPYKPEPLSESLRFALAFFLIPAIPISGISGALIGLLSIFHRNLTKAKRIILFIISLLPITFTILLLFIDYQEKPQDCWLTIRRGVDSLVVCWLINGPAIIIGKHFLPVSWSILRRLRLVSGDYPG